VAGDAVVHKRRVVGLCIGHPRGCGVAVRTIFPDEWYVIGWTWHSVRLARIMAGGAWLASHQRITVIKMCRLEGDCGVTVGTIIRGQRMQGCIQLAQCVGNCAIVAGHASGGGNCSVSMGESRRGPEVAVVALGAIG
jgi:hypothetical protein